MNSSIGKLAALHALGMALYVALVSTPLFYGSVLFGGSGQDVVLIPIAMLLLLVVSVAVSGLLILGRPVLWYLEGKKKEAVSLLLATIGCLFVLTVLAFLGLAIVGRM